MDSLGDIAIVGLTVHGRQAADLADFTLARDRRRERLPELTRAAGASELVYLATCNRVEVVYRAQRTADRPADLRGPIFRFLRDREALSGEAERELQFLSGNAAVRHLFEVAAGLDSAQLGEREIQGQLREARAESRAAGTCGSLLEQLIGEALRVARLVHVRTELGRGRVSLAEIAVDLLLERVRRTPSPVALVGVTAMTRRAAEILVREKVPFILVNRDVARAEALVVELHRGSCLSLDEFRRAPPQVEAVLTASGAPAAILDRAALERLAAHTASQESPLIVDLAIPPDVGPEEAREADVQRIGLDEILGVATEQSAGRHAEARAARQVVDEAVQDLRRRLAHRALAPAITRIHQRYRETALEGVERLLNHRGVLLDSGGRETLVRWAETLARRFAHLPSLGLRALAAEEGMDAVRSFLAAADPEALAALADLSGPGARATPEGVRGARTEPEIEPEPVPEEQEP